MYINGKINNKVAWSDIEKFEEARSYYKLAVADSNEGVILDKECFTKGDADSFKQWMRDSHPEVVYGSIESAFDK